MSKPESSSFYPPFSQREIQKVIPTDGNGDFATVYTDTPQIEAAELYLYRVKDTPTITTPIVVNTRTVYVNDTTNVLANDLITFYEGERLFQSTVYSKTATSIEINGFFEYPFTGNALVEVGLYNLNVDGSTTPQHFTLKSVGIIGINVHTINISMQDASEIDGSKFGGIAALDRGLLWRLKKGSFYKNLSVQISNNSIWETGFNIDIIDDSLGPSGLYSFHGRRQLSTVDGSIINIRPNLDELIVTVQDDLSDLTSLRISINGHRARKM